MLQISSPNPITFFIMPFLLKTEHKGTTFCGEGMNDEKIKGAFRVHFKGSRRYPKGCTVQGAARSSAGTTLY
jgi:hypothetical protein